MQRKTSSIRKLGRKKTKREKEKQLLCDLLTELEMGDEAYWRQKTSQWPVDPEDAPTLQQIASFEERLDREVKQIQGQKRQAAQAEAQHRAKTWTCLRRAAMILAFLLVFAGTTLYHTVESFAAGVNRFIATVLPEDGAEELRTQEKVGARLELDIVDYDGMYVPEWLPKGYTMSGITTQMHWRKIVYLNKQQDMICFEIAQKEYSVIVDDEDVTAEIVYLHDSQGRIITTEDEVCVVWEDGDYLYTVSGRQELRQELLEIATRCIKIKAGD